MDPKRKRDRSGFWPAINKEVAWRIKPDTTFTMSDGSHPKYLSRVGDKPRAFFPHMTMLELLSDPKANVVITEGGYITLAIAEAMQKDSGVMESRRYYRLYGIAERFQVSRSYVYYLIRKGKIKAVRIGRLHRIPRKEYCRLCRGTGGYVPCFYEQVN